MVVLDERFGNAESEEALAMIGLEKKASGIRKHFRAKLPDVWERGGEFLETQASMITNSLRTRSSVLLVQVGIDWK